jgi:hypothetical protein
VAKSTDMHPDVDPLLRSLSRGLAQLLTTLLFIALLVYWGITGSTPGRGVHETSPLIDVRLIGADFGQTCGAFGSDRRPIKLSMFSAPAKREWIDQAAAEFSRMCPNIQLQVEHLEDLDATQTILASGVAPSLWAPTSAAAVEVLAWAWPPSPFDPSAGRPLIRAPVVWLGPSEAIRAVRALVEHAPNEGPWLQVACGGLARDAEPTGLARADMLPNAWTDWYAAALSDPSVEQIADDRGPLSAETLARWGRVQFRYPQPLEAAVGFAAIYMIALDYLVPPASRTGASDLDLERFASALEDDDEPLAAWLRRCQAGIGEFQPSAADLGRRLFTAGIDTQEIIVVSERVAFELLETFDEHPDVRGELAIFYPATTVVHEHPVFTAGDPATADAAERWIAYLHSRRVQTNAITLGLRPAAGDGLIRTLESEANPFLRYRRFGAAPELPSASAPELDGEHTHALMLLWSEALGRI